MDDKLKWWDMLLLQSEITWIENHGVRCGVCGHLQIFHSQIWRGQQVCLVVGCECMEG